MKKIVVLTGAGISAESGIKTFRASDGLWEEHRVEDVATPEGFAANPKLVQKFYNERRRKLFEVKPNAAHLALAKLEEKMGNNLLIVTQNIDDLHERAGTKNLIKMHGSLFEVRCVKTGKIYHWEKDITDTDLCSCCTKPQVLRPHIVWFGEMPIDMDKIVNALSQCDVFVSIGTSGNVYPAAGFVREAKYYGAKTLELNLQPSVANSLFDVAEYGKATELVPKFVDKILSEL